MNINEMSFVSNVTSSHSTQRNLLKANANPLRENELMLDFHETNQKTLVQLVILIFK